MSLNRRACLGALTGAAVFRPALGAASEPLGIPGPFRGKVIGVTHSKCIRDDQHQLKPIRAMIDRAVCELTGATDPREAWRLFIEPGDRVGIKVNPVGNPYVCSSRELLHSVLESVKGVGVPPQNIVVYERYRANLEDSPYLSWVPKEIRLGYAGEAYDPIQQDIRGYDPECYVELPFALPGFDEAVPSACRSHAALFISRDVTKLINIASLKSHNAAGVTLSLKNLSHGLVNNVSRSHDGPELRYTEFIPAVVGMPVIRNKTVLNIIDGCKGLFHGGPGITGVMAQNFVWEHKTLYVGTDPVALDVIARDAIEQQRKKGKLWPLAEAQTDEFWKSPRRQPQYIEAAGRAGLGEWDPAKIQFKPIKVG